MNGYDGRCTCRIVALMAVSVADLVTGILALDRFSINSLLPKGMESSHV